MLQLYDKNKNKIKGLTKYKDYCIESVLKTGDKTLSFLYPSKFIDGIVEEGYIRNKTDEFVIKEMADRGDWTSIKVQMNVEDLEGKAWEHFNTTEQTIENCLNLACAGTGWTVQVNNVSKKRTVKKTNCSSWDLIQEAKKIYRVEIEFDTLNKVVKVYEKLGQDKGVYFSDEINLKALDIESNSYDFYTKIIAIGKENIKVEVENFQYSNKVKTLIWKDERYTVLENLREDATAKLQELSKPRKSYSADVIDLANLNSKYKNILDYKLGDTITLIYKDKKIREKQRIVKIVEYPDEPERNSCEIANTTLDFIDIQKEFQDTADTVNNITEDNGTISEEAIKVTVKNLTIDKADINSLNAAVARIGTLEATKANITELNAVNAKITNLQVNKAEITDLIAGNIKFDVATGGTLDLQTLLSKFVTGENGQFLNLTTDNVTISNAVIKDIIAKNISVEDLKVGNIDSNRFNIVGTDGNLLIKDNTIQIKDSARVRVQIGKDASGDYSMYVWDKQGNLMFDALGLKSSAIKDKIIRDDMVADNANINGSKLNISSLITEVNKDNTQTLKASRISFDSTGQSLEVSFNSLKSTVNDTKSKTESNTTSIGVINGQIDTLIKDTIIEENGTTVKLKDSYSTLKQTINGINATVASHTSFIGALNSNVSTIQSSITQLNNKIDLKVESTEVNTIVNNAVNNIQIGGRNLALGTSSEYSTPFTNFDGGVNRIITLGKVLTDGLSIGDTMSVKLVYKYDNVVPTTGKTATCWIQGYGTSTGWGPGFFEPSPRFNPTGSGEYEFIYRITINEEHLKNKFWTTSIRHDNILSGSVQWKMFKVENGNKSTDWSQAPEDVDQAISTVDTKLTTTNNKVASIEANLSSITQRVSSTESSISTINGNVTGLTTRVNTVEQNITATAITTTISSAINAGTSTITTTQFVMDKTGFTVKNGAIKILNKAGQTVLSGDTNGNLTVKGTITGSTITGSTITGSEIISQNLVNKQDLTIEENGGYLGRIVFKPIVKNSSGVGVLTTKGYIWASSTGLNIQANGSTSDTIGLMTNKVNVDGNISFNNVGIEQQLRFEGAGSDSHLCYFYSGSSSSSTRIGLYDKDRSSSVWRWLTSNEFQIDAATRVPRIYGNGGTPSFYVGTGGCRIEADSALRLYTSWMGNADNGINIGTDGSVQIKCNSVNRHIFFAGGTKTGGTMEVEGTVYGMSPTDSPQTLIEYIIPDTLIHGELKLELDPIYIKMISYYVAFLSNKNIEIKEKGQDYIILAGNGTTDILIKGQRKDADDYFRIMGGIEHGVTEGQTV